MKNYIKTPKLNMFLLIVLFVCLTFSACDEKEMTVYEGNITVVNEVDNSAVEFVADESLNNEMINNSDIVEESLEGAIDGDLLNSPQEGESEENSSDSPQEDESEGNSSDSPQKDESEENSSDMSQEETGEEVADQSEQKDAEANSENEQAGVVQNVTPGSKRNIAFDPNWTYAQFSEIHTGEAVLYSASANRNGIVVAVNAGHGTKGGTSVKTYCHPDMTPKVTGGSTAAGSIKAIAVSSGMSFYDGTAEASVTLRMAEIFRDKLLAAGYDVLMIRDGADVQLDNVARTLMANNNAACHIAIHWDGDNLSYDKGCFFMSTPDGIKGMEPVASTWQKSEALGKSLIAGLSSQGCKIYKNGSMAIDLTQTSYSSIASIDIELGNAASTHDDASLSVLGDGMLAGVNAYFGR